MHADFHKTSLLYSLIACLVCSSLEELDMMVNEIGDAGAVKIAECLRGKPNFRMLSLQGNTIDDDQELKVRSDKDGTFLSFLSCFQKTL